MNTIHHSSLRGIMLLAAMASVLVHLAILFWLHALRLDFGPPMIDPIQPRRFHLERAKIDSQSIERHDAHAPPALRDLEMDPGKIAAFSGPLPTPSVALPKIVSETPAPLGVETSKIPIQALSAIPIETRGNITHLAQALADDASTQALKETSQALRQNDLAGGASQTISLGSTSAIPKFDDISSLVHLKPPASLDRPSFQPILLRLSSDVLFEFDSAVIQTTALPALQRVAQLIGEAVKARVTIEGHTDTIGESPYNQRLSEQRAQAVSDWLEAQLGLRQNAFAVHGFGKTRPIVNPRGTQDEQAPNRRVEIRIEAEK